MREIRFCRGTDFLHLESHGVKKVEIVYTPSSIGDLETAEIILRLRGARKNTVSSIHYSDIISVSRSAAEVVIFDQGHARIEWKVH